MIGLKSVKQEN